MATTTITDLPSSRALDYKAMSAIRGAAGAGDWCLYAFTPYQSAPTSPIVIYLNTTQNALSLNHTGPA